MEIIDTRVNSLTKFLNGLTKPHRRGNLLKPNKIFALWLDFFLPEKSLSNQSN